MHSGRIAVTCVVAFMGALAVTPVHATRDNTTDDPQVCRAGGARVTTAVPGTAPGACASQSGAWMRACASRNQEGSRKPAAGIPDEDPRGRTTT